jgi:hypothetical protein
MADQIAEDTMEDADMSSDLPLPEEDDSGAKGSHPKPETLAKRKASPDCIEETQIQKKIKPTENEIEDSTKAARTTVAAREKPQESLSLTQKNYLVKKLVTLQGRRFAAEFVSAETSLSDDTCTGPAPMDINTMMAKLLEDKYPSSQAFQDDIQLTVEDPASYNGKKVLDHVNRFMEKLPKSPKKKADEKAKDDSAANITRTLHPGQSATQERETTYALKQVQAFRNGTQSNTGKKMRDLVLEKARYLAAEERKKKAKQAEERQRRERTTRLMAIGTKSTDETETEKAKDNKNSEVEKVDGDSVDDSMKDLQSEKNNDDPIDDIEEEHGDKDPQDDHTDQEVDEAIDREDEEVKENHTSLATSEHIGSDGKIALLIDIPSYEKKLSKLSKALPTQQQIDELDRAALRGPPLLGRTVSTVRGLKFGQHHRKTNGYTTNDVFLPAADSRNSSYCSHRDLVDLSQGEIVYMVGNHLIWKDLIADELLSYSKDPLFLVVHGLRRYHEDQGNVTIQFLDRRKAKTPDGRLAKIYSALDIYTIFGVPKWRGWGHIDDVKLHPRKFTQEYLSHGPVLTPGTIFKQALVKDLIRDGLYKIFPDFEAPEDHKRSGLYTLQVVYRKIGYPPASTPPVDVTGESTSQADPADVGAHTSTTLDAAPSSSPPPSSSAASTVADTSGALPPSPDSATSVSTSSKSKPKKAMQPIYSYTNCKRKKSMTTELLEIVRKVTLNFLVIPEGADVATNEPPLHALICFLTFEKRQEKDPVFLAWIKQRYNGISNLPVPSFSQPY